MLKVFIFLIYGLFAVNLWAADKITLLGEDAWYPYSGNKDGQLKGFAVDVLRAAYQAVNVEVVFVGVPYARCMANVKAGEALGCFNTARIAPFAENFLFHQQALYKVTLGIYARTEPSLPEVYVRDLVGRRVGVTHGTPYGSEIDENPKIIREVAPHDLSSLRKLLLFRSDYSLIATRVVDHILAAYPHDFAGKIQQVGVVNQENLYVSFSVKRPESQRFANLLDQGLLIIRANGIYAQLEKNWKTPEK